ncbi:MAG TPA: hypothetical protein VFG68_15865 [Fimbriiglobus sp.]|nr:hypothetical protein [Fimbriiglobus sp.]
MTPVPLQPDESLDRPAGCAAFEAVVNAVLDGELGPDALESDHPAGCRECRASATAARQLLGAPLALPTPPHGLAERIVITAMRDRRARQRRRLVGLALAASVVVGTAAFLLRPSPVEPREIVQLPPPLVVPEAPPPRVSDRFAEAGSALLAITNRAKDQTVNPTRTLIPPPESISVPTALPGIEPAAESLAEMPEALRSGIEPVTAKTRRAVNLFLRDVGLGTPAKPKL